MNINPIYYSYKDIPILIREMLDDLHLRMIYQRKLCSGVSLSIGYSKNTIRGFHHQMKMDVPTDNVDTLYEHLMTIFNKHIKDYPIRTVSIVLNNTHHTLYYQTSLFIDQAKEIKQRKLLYTIAAIKEKYGKNSILRTTALLPSSTIKQRHTLIGGHKK